MLGLGLGLHPHTPPVARSLDIPLISRFCFRRVLLEIVMFPFFKYHMGELSFSSDISFFWGVRVLQTFSSWLA